jgi:hypothetical protein
MTKPGASPFRPPSTASLPGSAALRPSGSSLGGGPIGLGAAYEDPNPTLSAGVDAIYSAVASWDWYGTRLNVQARMADLVDRLKAGRGYDTTRSGIGTVAMRFGFPFSGALVELRCTVPKVAEDAQFALKEFEPFRILHVADEGELTGYEPAGGTAELRGTTELERVLEASQAEDWLYTYEPSLCHRYWFLVTMETILDFPQSIDRWRLLASQTRDLSGPSLLEKTWSFLSSLVR